MADRSSIEWTDATWSPIRGCTRISPGCTNCYAERLAARGLPGMNSPTTGEPFAIMTPSGPRWTGKVELIESKLTEPLRWRKPRRIFVNSISDTFHESVLDKWIDRIFAVMALCPQHTFMVLTKRAERMREWFKQLQAAADKWLDHLCAKEPCKKHSFTPSDILNLRWMHWRFGRGPAFPYGPWPLPNVWLGVSVEDQRRADERIPHLLATPAAVRFLSVEPLLGPVSFRWASWDNQEPHPRRATQLPPVERDGRTLAGSINHLDGLRMLDFVIVGGESGPGARPCSVDAVRSIVRQCQDAGVACFVKQLGARAMVANTNGNCRNPECTHPDCGWMRMPLADPKGGDHDEWPLDLRVREWPCSNGVQPKSEAWNPHE